MGSRGSEPLISSSCPISQTRKSRVSRAALWSKEKIEKNPVCGMEGEKELTEGGQKTKFVK